MGLVITIRDGESFTVGENCKITITKTNRKSNKVLIEAPKEVAIKRLKQGPLEYDSNQRNLQ